VAPLAEQHRIVAEVEKQFSRLDATVTMLKRVEANLKRARASVLKAAVEGRLVPTEAQLSRAEGRTYEPASVLLARILDERKTRWPKGKKYKPPVEPTTEGLPVSEGWEWTSLDAIADVIGGVTKNKGQTEGRNVPYLRVANVQRGHLNLTEIKWIIASEAKIAQTRLVAGDILLNEGGDRDKLGRGWVWEGQIPECIHQNHVFRARIIAGLAVPKYISYYANSVGQSFFLDEGKQTTNLASISLSKIKRLPVALPPLAEQHRIVAEVERRMSVLDDLEATVTRSLARCARVRQSILKRAFEGKLVPQDPSDEPASVLLEKLPSA
jgi:type I restriction enzyme, S subunit